MSDDMPNEKAYNLTEVSAPGENVITKYVMNDDGISTARYYRIDLKTEYGKGPNSQTWSFVKNSNDNNIFVKDPTNPSSNVTVRFDTSNPQSQTENTTDNSSVSIEGSFSDMLRKQYKHGGAISNNGADAKLSDITGYFINNSVSGSSVYGGAIYNSGTIADITGGFIGNHSKSNSTSWYYAAGGAIANEDGTIGNITGDFVGNYAQSTSSGRGGAVYNDNGTVGNISGVFIGNYTSANSTYGGAIYNGSSGIIGDITASFIGNYAAAAAVYTNGGAIYNSYAKIGNIEGDFIGNYIFSYSTSTASGGGAIYNDHGTTGNIKGDFIGNYIFASYGSGGAISNAYDGKIGDITGNFIGNYINAFTFASAYGGAIYNSGGKIGAQDAEGNITGGIINSSFINNYAKAATESGEALAQGGAIYNARADLNIIADNGLSLFTGNYTEANGIRESNAIYMGSSSDTLTLKSVNNGLIQFDDKINGEAGYKVTITGDDTSKIILNNNVDNAVITSENVTLNLGTSNVFENSDFTMNSGTLSLLNGAAEVQTAKSFNINGNINMAVDVNLAKSSMDTLPTDTTVDLGAQIGVSYLNLLNDAVKDKTQILFAPEEYKAQVAYAGASPISYSPIYKYETSYNPEDGMFTFLRGSSTSSNPSDSYNPSVLAPSVVTQAGAYTTQIQTFNYAFQHADNFMSVPHLERLSIKNANKYALSPTGDATDVGTFSPLLTPNQNEGFWVKPYSSFESIPLHNGPKVSNINYGTLIGHDSELKSLRHGWDRVITSYIGYNGASQRYQGVDAYQNGGILGGTLTHYKNNFFNAITISAGATAGTATNMYGSENYTMLLAGIADKFGYNFEFKEGKYIIQPSMLLSYTFVNTFDYNNAAGVRIKSDPLNALQLSPGIKFIMNTKSGWQPYLGVNMIWNILDNTKVTANDVRLPEMSIDPYVQYGIGIQKRWNERYTAYAQTMIHNGGRNGVSLSAGLRWAIGKK